MEKNAKIYIAGHRGLVGSAIKRKLEKDGYVNIICKTHQELDLMHQEATKHFFETEKPEYVFLAWAKVGGIMANMMQPAEYIYNNLQIQNNVIHYAYLSWVKKLIFLGSSCIYPKECPQPIKEEYLLTWPLEETNLPYAIAKIAGIKMCQSYNRQYGTNFISCMPTNLYGPNDNFDLNSSHVFPAMIRKFHEAKINKIPEVVLRWDGTPYREFLHVDDMADACIFMMNMYTPTEEENATWKMFLNIWTWEDISIKDLALLIQQIIWYEGQIQWDTNKPNGTPKKLLDVSKLHDLWWNHKVNLHDWIVQAYQSFITIG